jgi:hypothetical protein
MRMVMMMMMIIIIIIIIKGSRNSSVDITRGYGLDDRGSIPSRCKSLFFIPQFPGRLWNPLSLLPNGHRRPFPRR